MSIEQQVRDYIHANFLFSVNGVEIDVDDSFLERGILDSTGIQELIAFLEGQFSIKILDEELSRDNLDSLRQVCAFVQRKQAQQQVLRA